LLIFYLNKHMIISPNTFEHHNNLRQGTLIPSSDIIKTFNITDIKNNKLTVDGLHTEYPTVIYDKASGLFNGHLRNSKNRINFWFNLKDRNPELYNSQLADLTSVPFPNQKNREQYKQFIKDHELLVNTMKVFFEEWRELFKSVLGVPDDHSEYKIIREWTKNIKSSWDFLKDFLQDGGTKHMSDERLAEYHQTFIDSINQMQSTGSNNPFQMIISQELKDATLDTVYFSKGMAYVSDMKFDTLNIGNNAEGDFKGCICLKNCELHIIDITSRCDLFAAQNTTIKINPNLIVYEAVYLDNVKCDEPISLNIASAEALILNNTELSDFTYSILDRMVNALDKNKERKILLYSFDGFKEKGVCSSDSFYYPNGHNKAPVEILGTFIGMFNIHFDDQTTIKRLFRMLNMESVKSFSIYTDDSKLMEFVYNKTEGKKYGGIPAGMFFLLKKLLNK